MKLPPNKNTDFHLNQLKMYIIRTAPFQMQLRYLFTVDDEQNLVMLRNAKSRSF